MKKKILFLTMLQSVTTLYSTEYIRSISTQLPTLLPSIDREKMLLITAGTATLGSFMWGWHKHIKHASALERIDILQKSQKNALTKEDLTQALTTHQTALQDQTANLLASHHDALSVKVVTPLATLHNHIATQIDSDDEDDDTDRAKAFTITTDQLHTIFTEHDKKIMEAHEKTLKENFDALTVTINQKNEMLQTSLTDIKTEQITHYQVTLNEKALLELFVSAYHKKHPECKLAPQPAAANAESTASKPSPIFSRKPSTISNL